MRCEVCGQECIREDAELDQSFGKLPGIRWSCPAKENMDGRSHWIRWERSHVDLDTEGRPDAAQ